MSMSTPFSSSSTSPTVGRLTSLRQHPFFKSSSSVDRRESFWSDCEEVPKPPKVERRVSTRFSWADVQKILVWGSITGFEGIRSISNYSTRSEKKSRKMGNQQSNPRTVSHELKASPSTGPDPTIFRVPLLTPPPTSSTMEFTPTDQTFSRIDYTPAPKHLPHASYASMTTRSKGIVRKLSTKARGFGDREVVPMRIEEPRHTAGVKAMKTLGGDMKSFEALIESAEARQDAKGIQSVNTAKASTFAAHRARRSSIPELAFDPPATSSPITFPSVDSFPGVQQPRPTHHRKTSSGSFKQPTRRNGSIRSARRAEREWRAKVAALAAGGVGPTRSSHVELRGPVPPRRAPRNASTTLCTPANLDESRSASPADDPIITPPQMTVETARIGKEAIASTIRSDRSFETLGHHAHIPRLQVNINNSPLPPRNRLVSVPRLVSSFYFDPTSNSRVSTRRNSMAASTLLSPTLVTSTFEAPPPVSPHRTQLPPFGSFQSSPVTSQDRLPGQQARPLRQKHDWNSTNRHERRSSAGVTNRPPIEPIKFNSLPAQSRLQDTHSARQMSGLTLDFIPIGDCQSQSPRRASHQPTSSQSPGTPYSPITAYILTAPIEQIFTPGFDVYTCPSSGVQPPITPSHPFATMQEAYSPEAPTPPSKSPLPSYPTRTQPLQSVWTKGSMDPFASIPPRRTHQPSQSQSRAHQPGQEQSRPSVAQSRSKSGTSSIPSVLQPRKINAPLKQQILGSGVTKERCDLEKERTRRKDLGVNLTPGMESGVRPPKSGLPMNDLHRWLQQTSIQA